MWGVGSLLYKQVSLVSILMFNFFAYKITHFYAGGYLCIDHFHMLNNLFIELYTLIVR